MTYLKRAWAEISLDAIKENLENYKKYITGNTEILCVVKASCYGHSDGAVVPFLQNELGIKWFAVSNEEEAVRLRHMGITGEILILGYTPPEAAELLADNNIIQAITEYNYAVALSKHTKGKTIRCHTAVDTGMTRIGVHGSIDDMCDEIQKIVALKGISMEGIFTHYAVADSDGEDNLHYTSRQTKTILAVDKDLKARGVKLSQTHFLNSAGGIYHYSENSTLARLGITLYGLMPNTSKPIPYKLKPALKLKAVVSQVKEITAGTTVSYGRTYTATADMKLATVTIGYADGYPRLLSNKGEVLIHGKRCKITGRICMDQFMCDVSHLENVNAGDIVTLIGDDGDEEITADELADSIGTIGYELICGISARVPRVIFKNGRETAVIK